MNGREPERSGNRDPFMAPHGIFKCRDLPEKVMDMTIDRWVSIVCADDAEWGRLALAMGRPELADDPRFKTLAARKANEDELEALVTSWTLPQRFDEVARKLQAAGVAAAPCADNKYLCDEDQHVAQRNYWVELNHPEVGVQRHAGIPWRMSATPTAVRAPAPCLGQHTDETLARLGYSKQEVESLRKIGALD
jgi:crotonobetainyl-CoA:carnitine CoA-transferase CaiB-like acyl-CoA transferase